MTKIDIFSGFLGAGKTTLIKKLIEESYQGEKIVLIENEFGEIGIDSGFLAEAGIQINEMNSGCICCSLVGDFAEALQKVIAEFAPDRILIEPSGVGKLSDVIKAVKSADTHEAVLNSFTTVVDANKCKMHMKNFGEFFNDQVKNAGCIILSHTGNMTEQKIIECVDLLKQHNPNAVIISTPWNLLSGVQMIEAIERKDTLDQAIERLHSDHHHHDGEECHCHDHEHHHHHDGEECHCHDHNHEHHHHHDGEECHCHDHEHHHHHHDEDGNCSCGHHHHEHHHHHHADEIFISFGAETVKKFNKDLLEVTLADLVNEKKYGMVLRAKGIVESDTDSWIHFDYVPGEPDIRYGTPGVIGRLCVIGSNLSKDEISKAFGVEFR